MSIKELAEYCNQINIDCDTCEHKKECTKFNLLVEDISPSMFLNLTNKLEYNLG